MYGIIYNSDVIIDDPSILGSLCVFYDHVFLPEIGSRVYIQLVPESDDASSLRVGDDVVSLTYAHPQRGIIESGEDVDQWEKENHPLITAKVIRRLDSPKRSPLIQDLIDLRDTELFRLLLASPHVLTDTVEGQTKASYFVRLDTIAHLMRTDLELPSIFLTRNRTDKRKIFTTLEARSVFSYFLPNLAALRPEQIIEVREKVADNREGFLMHLQKLSKEVESRINQGAPLADIEAAAQDIVETDIIPDYHEFRRQLEAEKAGFWSKVLDRSSKVLEIDAAPWTPKFWSDLIRCLALTGLDAAAERKQSLTNEKQAFHFMMKIDDYDDRG